MGNHFVCSFFDWFSAVFSDLADSSLQLYVLIHNLDSQMLRGERSQRILAQLSSLPSIYLIASIDHINAPLSESPWAWCSRERRICILLWGCWACFIRSCITVDVQNRSGDVCMVVAARSPSWDCGCVEPKLYKRYWKLPVIDHNIQIDFRLLAPFDLGSYWNGDWMLCMSLHLNNFVYQPEILCTLLTLEGFTVYLWSWYEKGMCANVLLQRICLVWTASIWVHVLWISEADIVSSNPTVELSTF